MKQSVKQANGLFLSIILLYLGIVVLLSFLASHGIIMGKVSTFEQIVDKARAVHGDRYEYVQLIKDTGEPIKIVCVCPAHGQFTIRAARHYTEGKGCPKCSRVTSMEEFLHRANSKHGKRYDYSRVQLTALSDKVDIVCEKHGGFTQKAGDHILHYGCPKCGIHHHRVWQPRPRAWPGRRAVAWTEPAPGWPVCSSRPACWP